MHQEDFISVFSDILYDGHSLSVGPRGSILPLGSIITTPRGSILPLGVVMIIV